MKTYEEDLYGLNTEGKRPPSILELIQTCKVPKQLEWVVRYRVLEAEHPSKRTLRRWRQAIAAKQKEFGIRVMWSGEEVVGAEAHGG